MRYLAPLALCFVSTVCMAQGGGLGDLFGEGGSGTEPQTGNKTDAHGFPHEAGDPAGDEFGSSLGAAPQGNPKKGKNPSVRNPFDVDDHSGMEMMMEDMDMGEGGYGSMGEEMEDMGMGMMGGMDDYGGGMDMEGYGGGDMGMGYGTSHADHRFQRGLQRAITALKQSKSADEKKILLSYVRNAFQERYDQSIKKRREELSRIKERITKLESDLKRRESAKARVVEVQLQSVQLAAEGLLELNER